jgi:hypothetical protein
MSIKSLEHVEVDTQHRIFESYNPSAQTRRVSLPEATAVVVPARYVLLCLATAITGYTVKAMQRKIERGDWQEGKLGRELRTVAFL